MNGPGVERQSRRFRISILQRDRLYIGAIVLLIVSAVVHGGALATRGIYTRSGDLKGTDFAQFYLMGWLARSSPVAALYDIEAHRAASREWIDPRLHAHAPYPNYGPHVALLFVPFTAFSYAVSLAIFTGLSASAYFVAVWILVRGPTTFERDRPLVLLAAAAAPAFLATLRFGQLSAFSLLLLALAVESLRRGRSIMAGACIGSLAFKPSLLVVAAPVWLLARDWRCLAGLVTAGTAHLLAGAMAGGPEGLALYVRALLTLMIDPDRVVLFPENAHSIRGALRLAGTSPGLATAVSSLALVAVIPALSHAWRVTSEPLVRVGLIAAATVLVSPHVLTYDLLLLTVPLVAAADLASAQLRPTGRLAVAALAVYAAALSPPFAAWSGVQISTLAVGAFAILLQRAAVDAVATKPPLACPREPPLTAD
jgi:alpha-1,2-mannosyltransferase